jgi:hypothetical protein
MDSMMTWPGSPRLTEIFFFFIVYVFVGSIILGDYWYNWVTGTVVGVSGLVYVVLEFIPSIEPPSNMREAEAGWGAEQV